MGFIVDSRDHYIINTNDIKKIYCMEYYTQGNEYPAWILWADCIDGRFQLDKKNTKEEIRDSFWRYYKMLDGK